MKASFITWLPHCRRSDALAAVLGGKSYLIHYLGFKRPWQALLKYPLQTLITFVRLYRDKPGSILVATPPVFAALPVYAYARTRGIPFVVDAHTGTFDNSRWTWLLPLSRWMSRRATLTIVTNEYLAGIVQSWGARVIVIGIVPIVFPPAQATKLGDGINVAVISTFSHDEPIEAIVDAARNVPSVSFYITGDIRRAPQSLQTAATLNVHFTGWLSEERYTSLLKAATAIMVLTTRDHTMQRGAYEAMALEKPLITSDWPLLRQTFSMGTVYVDNTTAGITVGLKAMIREHERLASEMRELHHKRDVEFRIRLDQFLTIVKQHHLGNKR